MTLFNSDETGAAEIQAERDRLRLLLEVTNLLISRHDLADLFQALSECIGRAIPHEYASVSLYEPDEAGRSRVFLVVLDGKRRPDMEGRSFTISADAAAHFDAGRPMAYDIVRLGLNNPSVAGVLSAHDLSSFCSVQLVSPRGALGILSVASRKSDAFGPEEVRLLVEASGQIAIAIDNGLAYDEIKRLKDQVLSEKRYLEQEILDEHGFHNLIGQSEPLRRALKEVDTVAATDATVLILGETGTGKELVARAIHERSTRSARNFVRVNCAAIPASLLESEMFGHERGAFTGAVAARPGRFEMAHRGTLFLDEVGELPIAMQPKFLRALQEREFERVGASMPTRVDVRLVAATNRHLGSMVQSGSFREDLFYRLNVFPIRLPSLRERRDDIPALVSHFVRKHAVRLNRTIAGVPVATMEALCAWDWPGNIRELENVIERAVILATDGMLRVPLPARIDGSADLVPKGQSLGHLATVERDAILDALRAAGGLVGGATGAAARLGLKRTTLQSRMRKLGIAKRAY